MITYISRILSYEGVKIPVLGTRNCHEKNDEPKSPNVKTEIPGPKSKALLKQLKLYQNVGKAELFGNYEKSIGNYLVDADGNIFLDLNMQGSNIPFGYNFKELTSVFSGPKYLHYIIDAINLNAFPGTCCPSRIEKIIDRVSPNLPNLCICPCDSTAVEEGLKAIMAAYQMQLNEENNLSSETLGKTLNQGTDTVSPKLSILSFKNSLHGSTIGALNVSNADPWKKVDFATFDWPVADYPEYKYPLDENMEYNAMQDNQSLAMVEDLITTWQNKNIPVAGIIIEPLQTTTNHVISQNFMLGLEELTLKHGIYLMFDESKTCCGATGRFWAHEHYPLNCPPDILTFGGKTQISGFLHKTDLKPVQNNPLSSSGSLSVSKLILFEAIIDFIEKHNLMRSVQLTGEVLKGDLLKLQNRYHDLIHSTRGLGTILAFDVKTPKLTDELILRLRNKGILCGKCGLQGIAIRPSLTFNKKHAEIFVDNLENVIKEAGFKTTKPQEFITSKSPTGRIFQRIAKPLPLEKQNPTTTSTEAVFRSKAEPSPLEKQTNATLPAETVSQSSAIPLEKQATAITPSKVKHLPLKKTTIATTPSETVFQSSAETPLKKQTHPAITHSKPVFRKKAEISPIEKQTPTTKATSTVFQRKGEASLEKQTSFQSKAEPLPLDKNPTATPVEAVSQSSVKPVPLEKLATRIKPLEKQTTVTTPDATICRNKDEPSSLKKQSIATPSDTVYQSTAEPTPLEKQTIIRPDETIVQRKAESSPLKKQFPAVQLIETVFRRKFEPVPLEKQIPEPAPDEAFHQTTVKPLSLEKQTIDRTPTKSDSKTITKLLPLEKQTSAPKPDEAIYQTTAEPLSLEKQTIATTPAKSDSQTRAEPLPLEKQITAPAPDEAIHQTTAEPLSLEKQTIATTPAKSDSQTTAEVLPLEKQTPAPKPDEEIYQTTAEPLSLEKQIITTTPAKYDFQTAAEPSPLENQTPAIKPDVAIDQTTDEPLSLEKQTIATTPAKSDSETIAEPLPIEKQTPAPKLDKAIYQTTAEPLSLEKQTIATTPFKSDSETIAEPLPLEKQTPATKPDETIFQSNVKPLPLEEQTTATVSQTPPAEPLPLEKQIPATTPGEAVFQSNIEPLYTEKQAIPTTPAETHSETPAEASPLEKPFPARTSDEATFQSNIPTEKQATPTTPAETVSETPTEASPLDKQHPARTSDEAIFQSNLPTEKQDITTTSAETNIQGSPQHVRSEKPTPPSETVFQNKAEPTISHPKSETMEEISQSSSLISHAQSLSSKDDKGSKKKYPWSEPSCDQKPEKVDKKVRIKKLTCVIKLPRLLPVRGPKKSSEPICEKPKPTPDPCTCGARESGGSGGPAPKSKPIRTKSKEDKLDVSYSKDKSNKKSTPSGARGSDKGPKPIRAKSKEDKLGVSYSKDKSKKKSTPSGASGARGSDKGPKPIRAKSKEDKLNVSYSKEKSKKKSTPSGASGARGSDKGPKKKKSTSLKKIKIICSKCRRKPTMRKSVKNAIKITCAKCKSGKGKKPKSVKNAIKIVCSACKRSSKPKSSESKNAIKIVCSSCKRKKPIPKSKSSIKIVCSKCAKSKKAKSTRSKSLIKIVCSKCRKPKRKKRSKNSIKIVCSKCKTSSSVKKPSRPKNSIRIMCSKCKKESSKTNIQFSKNSIKIVCSKCLRKPTGLSSKNSIKIVCSKCKGKKSGVKASKGSIKVMCTKCKQKMRPKRSSSAITIPCFRCAMGLQNALIMPWPKEPECSKTALRESLKPWPMKGGRSGKKGAKVKERKAFDVDYSKCPKRKKSGMSWKREPQLHVETLFIKALLRKKSNKLEVDYNKLQPSSPESNQMKPQLVEEQQKLTSHDTLKETLKECNNMKIQKLEVLYTKVPTPSLDDLKKQDKTQQSLRLFQSTDENNKADASTKDVKPIDQMPSTRNKEEKVPTVNNESLLQRAKRAVLSLFSPDRSRQSSKEFNQKLEVFYKKVPLEDNMSNLNKSKNLLKRSEIHSAKRPRLNEQHSKEALKESDLNLKTECKPISLDKSPKEKQNPNVLQKDSSDDTNLVKPQRKEQKPKILSKISELDWPWTDLNSQAKPTLLDKPSKETTDLKNKRQKQNTNVLETDLSGATNPLETVSQKEQKPKESTQVEANLFPTSESKTASMDKSSKETTNLKEEDTNQLKTLRKKEQKPNFLLKDSTQIGTNFFSSSEAKTSSVDKSSRETTKLKEEDQKRHPKVLLTDSSGDTNQLNTGQKQQKPNFLLKDSTQVGANLFPTSEEKAASVDKSSKKITKVKEEDQNVLLTDSSGDTNQLNTRQKQQKPNFLLKDSTQVGTNLFPTSEEKPLSVDKSSKKITKVKEEDQNVLLTDSSGDTNQLNTRQKQQKPNFLLKDSTQVGTNLFPTSEEKPPSVDKSSKKITKVKEEDQNVLLTDSSGDANPSKTLRQKEQKSNLLLKDSALVETNLFPTSEGKTVAVDKSSKETTKLTEEEQKRDPNVIPTHSSGDKSALKAIFKDSTQIGTNLFSTSEDKKASDDTSSKETTKLQYKDQKRNSNVLLTDSSDDTNLNERQKEQTPKFLLKDSTQVKTNSSGDIIETNQKEQNPEMFFFDQKSEGETVDKPSKETADVKEKDQEQNSIALQLLEKSEVGTCSDLNSENKPESMDRSTKEMSFKKENKKQRTKDSSVNLSNLCSCIFPKDRPKETQSKDSSSEPPCANLNLYLTFNFEIGNETSSPTETSKSLKHIKDPKSGGEEQKPKLVLKVTSDDPNSSNVMAKSEVYPTKSVENPDHLEYEVEESKLSELLNETLVRRTNLMLKSECELVQMAKQVKKANDSERSINLISEKKSVQLLKAKEKRKYAKHELQDQKPDEVEVENPKSKCEGPEEKKFSKMENKEETPSSLLKSSLKDGSNINLKPTETTHKSKYATQASEKIAFPNRDIEGNMLTDTSILNLISVRKVKKQKLKQTSGTAKMSNVTLNKEEMSLRWNDNENLLFRQDKCILNLTSEQERVWAGIGTISKADDGEETSQNMQLGLNSELLRRTKWQTETNLKSMGSKPKIIMERSNTTREVNLMIKYKSEEDPKSSGSTDTICPKCKKPKIKNLRRKITKIDVVEYKKKKPISCETHSALP